MEPDDDDKERFANVIAATVAHVGQEQFLLAHLEQYFSPAPARLAEAGPDSKRLQQEVDQVIRLLGGPPRVIYQPAGEPKPRFDLYPAAAASEVVNMFHRARRSVARTQMSLVGGHGVRETPELFSVPVEGGVRAEFIEAIDNVFWEHAETAYIRLASYWDRVGQLLDFAFFGIRQFERDGFASVIDRIHNNIVPVDGTLAASDSWAKLRVFQSSEKEDGLKWLVRRRNIVIHSLYLRPLIEAKEKELFDSEFNHLDAALRKKLAPGTPVEELERMNGQLRMAAALFPAILNICRHARRR